MNNEMIRNHYDTFSRMEALGLKYGVQFAPASRATARKQPLPIVRNKFAGQAGILAEWAKATRIVRLNRTPEPPQPV
jgi:hypothetical protein